MMNRRDFLTGLGVILTPVCIGCRPSNIQNAGTQTECPVRLISTVPSLTETLFALGLGNRVIAVSDYCRYPEAVRSLPKIGGLYNPNIEKMVTLNPDLVLLLAENRDLADRLHSFSIETLAADHSSIEGIFDSFRIIGERFGSETAARASALTDRLRVRLDRLVQITAPLTKPKVLLCIDRERGTGRIETIYAAGKNPYFNELLRIAGGVNVFSGSSTAVPTVSAESLLDKNPEVIFDFAVDWTETERSIAEEMKAAAADWESLGAAVPAVRDGRIYPILEDYAAVPGPRFMELAERMAKCLHPEIEDAIE